MLVGMGVGMLMAVHLAVMGMFVNMGVAVIVGVQVFVFVCSFHGNASFVLIR